MIRFRTTPAPPFPHVAAKPELMAYWNKESLPASLGEPL